MEEHPSEEVPVVNGNGENEETSILAENLPPTVDVPNEETETSADIQNEPATVAENGDESAEIAPPAEANDNETDDSSPENANPDQLPDEMRDTFLVDAIGDTLYSKRFVLKTLLSLSTLEESLSEEFEKDLCTLWDMTIEKDVVALMLDHNVLEIFSNIIQTTEDQRLTEILLGIIANMCAKKRTRTTLRNQPDTMVPMIEMITCTDSLVLVQLMRVFRASMVFENSGDEGIWLEHFRAVDQIVEKFAYILSNSTSTTLLMHAFEAVRAICTKLSVSEIDANPAYKNGFRDLFVKPVLVESVIDAFHQMLVTKRADVLSQEDPNEADADADANGVDETIVPTRKTQRIVNLFLDINVILSQYEEHSLECFDPYMDRFYDCVALCLEPLCHPMHLLPLTVKEQILIENINEISQSLDGYFHALTFERAIVIWSVVMKMLADKERAKDAAGDDKESEWDRDEETDDPSERREVDANDVSLTLMEFIQETSRGAEHEEIAEAVKSLDSVLIVNLCDSYNTGAGDKHILECYEKLRKAAKLNWNIDIEEATVNPPFRLTLNKNKFYTDYREGE